MPGTGKSQGVDANNGADVTSLDANAAGGAGASGPPGTNAGANAGANSGANAGTNAGANGGAQIGAHAGAHAGASGASGGGASGGGSSSASRHHKRRPHTKSRNGCTTCKRRRVKCDETRPICKNCQHLRLECRFVSPASLTCADLQIMNLKLLHHYVTVVAQTIADSGISTLKIWVEDVVELGFRFPFLMHAVLMFSATHLSQRQPKEYCSAVVQHRAEALTLLRSEVQRINGGNLDALVATSVLLILDAMANAALPSRMTPSSLPASTWLHHVRGAATILLAVGVLPPTSKFYSFMGVDLLDLASCNTRMDAANSPGGAAGLSGLQCFMPELQELYPVRVDSPYFASLAFLDKLQSQRQCADFILRVFSFPALMDPNFIKLLADGDRWAKAIVGAYYKLVRNFVKEKHDKIWFLNGVSTVLPIDMDNELGGLGFVTDALPISQNVESILAKFDASFSTATASAPAGRTTLGALDFFEDYQGGGDMGRSPRTADNSVAPSGANSLANSAVNSVATSPNDSTSQHMQQQQQQQQQQQAPQFLQQQAQQQAQQFAPQFVQQQQQIQQQQQQLQQQMLQQQLQMQQQQQNQQPNQQIQMQQMQQMQQQFAQLQQQQQQQMRQQMQMGNAGFSKFAGASFGQDFTAPVMPGGGVGGGVGGGSEFSTGVNNGRIHKHMNAPNAIMPGSGRGLRGKYASGGSGSGGCSRLPGGGSTSNYTSSSRGIIRPGMMGLPVDPSVADQLLTGFDITGSGQSSAVGTPGGSTASGPAYPPNASAVTSAGNSQLDLQQMMMNSNAGSAAMSPAANSMSSGSNASPWPVKEQDLSDIFFDTDALEWKGLPQSPQPLGGLQQSLPQRSRVSSVSSSLMSNDVDHMMQPFPSSNGTPNNKPSAANMSRGASHLGNPSNQGFSFSAGQMNDPEAMQGGNAGSGGGGTGSEMGGMGMDFGMGFGVPQNNFGIKSEISDNDFERYIGLDGDEIISEAFD